MYIRQGQHMQTVSSFTEKRLRAQYLTMYVCVREGQHMQTVSSITKKRFKDGDSRITLTKRKQTITVMHNLLTY